MKIQCPHCERYYAVEQQYIGQKLKCPDCRNEFEVTNPNLIPCPDCFTQISKRAQSCPRCGAVLSSAIQSPDKRSSTVEQNDDISNESEIMVCHPSTMNYLWEIILGVITIPVFLIGLLILLYVWIEINYTSYTITTMRIIVKRGWIAKLQNEVWIKDMRAVNLIQGMWQRIIGVGNVSIGTAATAGTEICIVGIVNPQTVVDRINSLRHS